MPRIGLKSQRFIQCVTGLVVILMLGLDAGADDTGTTRPSATTRPVGKAYSSPAAALLAAGNLEAARKEAQKAIELHPDDPEAICDLADCEMNSIDAWKAWDDYGRAEQLKPEMERAELGRIECFVRFAEKQIIWIHHEGHSRDTPENGNISAEQMIAQTVADANRLLLAHPESAEALVRRARLNWTAHTQPQRRNEDDAIGPMLEDCRKAIELDPKYVFAYTLRAEAYAFLAGWYSKDSDCFSRFPHTPSEEYTRAIELEPNNPCWYECRAYANDEGLDEAKLRAALADLEKAVRLDPQIKVLKDSRIKFMQRDLPARLKSIALSDVIAKDPKNAANYAARSALYDNMGEKSRASEDMAKAIELAPNDLAVVEADARMHENDNDAIPKFDRLLALQPENTYALYQRALLLFRKGRNDKDNDAVARGISDVDHLLKINPDFNGDGNYGNMIAERADWFHQLNKDDLALADYQQIRKNTKDGPFMWEKEMREVALVVHTASGKLDVDDYVFQGRQMIQNGETGKDDQAGASFDKALSLDKDNIAARLGKIQLTMRSHQKCDADLLQAAAKFEEIVKDHPDWHDDDMDNYEFYLLAGHLHTRVGQNALALRDYGRCKELNPEQWERWNPKAMDEVVHAMNVSQGKLTLEDYCELTTKLYWEKKYEEALEQSAKAIEIAPASLLAYINHKELATICFDNVRESPRFLRMAFEDTKKLAELQPKGYSSEFEKTKEWVVWHCVNQASNLKAKEKFDEAQEYLELAVEALPDDKVASKDLASVKQARENHLHPPEAPAAKEPAAEEVHKEVHTYICPQCNGTKIIDVISDVFHPEEERRAIVRDAAPEGFWREKVIHSGWHPNEKHIETCPTCKGLGYIKVEE